VSNIKGKPIMKKLFNWLCIAMVTILAGQVYAAEIYGKAEDPVVAEVLGMHEGVKSLIDLSL